MGNTGTLQLRYPNHFQKQLEIELPPTVEGIAEAVETQWPELWQGVYPRIYDSSKIASHYSSKLVAMTLAGAVVERGVIAQNAQLQTIAQSSAYTFILANQLARFQIPTFYLSQSIAKAIEYTTPPMALAWHEMELPFEAAVFMLPRGLLQDSEGADAAYVAYARCKKDQIYNAPLLPSGSSFGISNGGLILTVVSSKGGRMYHHHWPFVDGAGSHGQAYPVIHLADLKGAMASNTDDTSRFFFPQGMTVEDRFLLQQGAHYLFGALLLLLNRPDLVESGRLLKRVEHKGRPRREFWSPNIIGAHYTVTRSHSVDSGSGSSPRMHWRRGHWRQQPYGPNRKLRRDTWIEPMLINPE